MVIRETESQATFSDKVHLLTFTISCGQKKKNRNLWIVRTAQDCPLCSGKKRWFKMQLRLSKIFILLLICGFSFAPCIECYLSSEYIHQPETDHQLSLFCPASCVVALALSTTTVHRRSRPRRWWRSRSTNMDLFVTLSASLPITELVLNLWLLVFQLCVLYRFIFNL